MFRAARAAGLLVLDRKAAGPDVDVEPLRLLVLLIELIAEHDGNHGERADDQIKHVVARHRRDLRKESGAASLAAGAGASHSGYRASVLMVPMVATRRACRRNELRLRLAVLLALFPQRALIAL